MTITILLFSTVILLISTIGLGSEIVSKLVINNKRLNLVFSFFVGEVLLSFVWILISIFTLAPYNVIAVTPVLLIGVVFFFKKNEPYLFKWPILKDKSEKYLFFVLISIIFFYFINSLISPFDWDVVSYHLPVVKELSSGKINFPLLQDNSYINFFAPFSHFFGSLPYSIESYVSILYSLSSDDSSSHLIYLFNFIFFLYIVSVFLNNFFNSNRFTNISVGILLLISHGTSIVLSTGLIDVNLLIFQFLAIFSALMITHKPRYAYLFIIFSSYAIGLKYTSLFILLPSFLYVLVTFVKNKNIIKEIGGLLTFISISTLLFFVSGGFWYFKNIFLHGNPVYPLYLGHRGMSEDLYKLLMDNLVYELRIGRNISDLFNLIKINYENETGIVLSLILLSVSYVFRIIKISKLSFLLIINLFWVYLINFYFGSQLSRFVLIVPTTIYILMSQILIKNRLITIVVVAVALLGIRFNPLQWSTWNSRINNTILFLTQRNEDLISKNIGCSFETYNYLKKYDTYALNFWDPYASVYFDSNSYFINISRDNNLKSDAKTNVNYIYVNNQYKLIFINTKEVHRDIDIVGRLKLEEDLIKGQEPVFKKDNCYLYRIN